MPDTPEPHRKFTGLINSYKNGQANTLTASRSEELLQATLADAIAAQQSGRLAEAAAAYEKVLELDPKHFDALHMLGVFAAQDGNFTRAAQLIGQAIGANAESVPAYYNLGYVLEELRQYATAVASYDRAIALKPDHFVAYNNRGVALKALHRLEDAVASFDAAIRINPGYAEAHHNRGMTLFALKQHAAAIDSYTNAIRIRPDYAEAHHGCGLALSALKNFKIAVVHFNQALSIRPNDAESHTNRGLALAGLRQYDAALADYDQALQLKPKLAEAHNGRGVLLQALGHIEAALASYDMAIVCEPNFAEAHYNRARLLRDLKRYSAAIEAYDRALQLNKNDALADAMRLHTKMQICDWRAHDKDVALLLKKIAQGENAVVPFPILTLVDDPAIHKRVAALYAAEVFPKNDVLGPIPKRPRREKVRIGYFSMDFRDHPVARLLAEIVEAHDRSRFEVYGFSFGPDIRDRMRIRLESAFDKFIDVRDQSDEDTAALARRLEIDIVVDLAGHTRDSRTGIFAMRAAPIQVTYLGYPGTMGADYYDYIIENPVVIPEVDRHHYAERVVHLPSYSPNDTSHALSDKVFTRADLGLPETGFVYCCFNNNFKISPTTFDSWMRILGCVPGSVLWLLEDNPDAANNLRNEAERRGIDSSRLIFSRRMPFGDYLACQRLADLFLDTLPYNAHTTTSLALWMGLPVLTCIGASFAARVAAGLLTEIDLPELITSTSAEFEDRAVALASNQRAMDDVRSMLARNLTTSSLFKPALYTAHLENAYAQMVDRYHADLPPEHIRVVP